MTDHLPSTNPEIFKKGHHICSISGPRSTTIEAWVQQVAKVSRQRVDWRLVGGVACVLYIGDRAKVGAAIDQLWESLIDAYMTCTTNFTQNPERRDVQRIWKKD